MSDYRDDGGARDGASLTLLAVTTGVTSSEPWPKGSISSCKRQSISLSDAIRRIVSALKIGYNGSA